MTLSIVLAAGCSAELALPTPTPAPAAPAPEPEAEDPDGAARKRPSRRRSDDGTHKDPRADGLRELAVVGEGIGNDRTAWIRVPEGKGPFPVVFAFHGGHHRNGLDMAPRLQAGFDRPVVFVFPNGDPENPDGIGWVGPGIRGVKDEQKDLRYVHALIDRLAEEVPIDRDRLYAVGFSNGGYMTHTLFCRENDLFQGFAMVARPIAKPLVEQCDRVSPKPVMLIAGTADDRVVNEHDLSVDDTVEFYRKKLSCKAERGRVRETLPDQGDATKVDREVWTQCGGKARLEYFRIEGGGHFWPGDNGRDRAQKSRDIDATREILRLFDL